MEKTISKIDQVRALTPASSRLEVKTISTSTGEQYCFETSSHAHDIQRLVNDINEILKPHLVIVTEEFEWKDDDRHTWSYHFDIILMSEIKLPAYYASESGYMTIVIPAMEDWRPIRILDSGIALEVGQIPLYSLEKHLRSGILRPATEAEFNEVYDKAIKAFSIHEAA